MVFVFIEVSDASSTSLCTDSDCNATQIVEGKWWYRFSNFYFWILKITRSKTILRIGFGINTNFRSELDLFLYKKPAQCKKNCRRELGMQICKFLFVLLIFSFKALYVLPMIFAFIGTLNPGWISICTKSPPNAEEIVEGM